MTDAPQLETVLAMGLQLPAKDRLKLVEQLARSVEREIEPQPESGQHVHWGQALVRALESGELDTSAWISMDMDDATEWVNKLRDDENKRLDSYWNDEA
jgi:hypothetical protein